jgi:hypothetical protein
MRTSVNPWYTFRRPLWTAQTCTSLVTLVGSSELPSQRGLLANLGYMGQSCLQEEEGWKRMAEHCTTVGEGLDFLRFSFRTGR